MILFGFAFSNNGIHESFETIISICSKTSNFPTKLPLTVFVVMSGGKNFTSNTFIILSYKLWLN